MEIREQRTTLENYFPFDNCHIDGDNLNRFWGYGQLQTLHDSEVHIPRSPAIRVRPIQGCLFA